MKVLHVTNGALTENKGGIESFIKNLCAYTSKLGVSDTVFSTAKKPVLREFEKFKIHEVQRHIKIASAAFSLSSNSKFKCLADEHDIIHYHYPNPYGDLLHLICMVNKPSIVTYHSDIIRQKKLLFLYKSIQTKFFNSVDQIVATSPNYFASSEILNDYSNKVSVIPIGLDKSSLEPLDNERVKFWRERLPEKFFLFIGAMRYYKGLHILVKAAQGTTIPIVIAGGGFMEAKIKKLITKKNITNIIMLGMISEKDKVALLKACIAFVFPSHLRSEAFGISLLEASIMGKPMISCEIGSGTSYVNLHNETGLVIPPGSARSLRDAMEFLLKNPKVVSEMGDNAKKRSKEYFSLRRQACSYLEIYNNLVSK